MTDTIASWHPFVVHFAVALTMASVFFDVLDFFLQRPSFERSGLHLMVAALPFLLLAVLSGNLASRYVQDIAPPAVLYRHVTYANIAIWVFCGAAAWRVFLQLRGAYAGRRKILYLFIVTAAAMSVFLAALNGGKIRHRPYTAAGVGALAGVCTASADSGLPPPGCPQCGPQQATANSLAPDRRLWHVA